MSDLSLYLTNFSVSVGKTLEPEKNLEGMDDFESVEMGEQVGGEQKGKVPRRTIYFASGETMEEYSTDEEEEEEPLKKDLMAVDPSKLTWGPYFWFYMWRAATSTISVCDYLGERMASLFGITSPKYQYAIDEYYRMKKEEEEEEEEIRLSEEAERQFEEEQRQGQKNLVPYHNLTVEQPESSGASFVNVSFELDPKPALSDPDNNRVLASLS